MVALVPQGDYYKQCTMVTSLLGPRSRKCPELGLTPFPLEEAGLLGGRADSRAGLQRPAAPGRRKVFRNTHEDGHVCHEGQAPTINEPSTARTLTI